VRENRLLTERDIRARLKISRSTFWRMRRHGQFPEPFEISRGCRRWTEKAYGEFLEKLGVEDPAK
jgi:predicted DNA-binding transcriptional regulator AlpA